MATLARSIPFLVAIALAQLAKSPPAGATHPLSPHSTQTMEELLDDVDDLMRSESSRGRITMRIRTDRWQRELTMRIQSKGTEKTLVQIEAPAKERGTATLKVDNNIWNYLPKVDRTIKVPASMMSGSWMGSHFTNDDLVQNSRYSEDYDCDFLATPADGGGFWLIVCIPKQAAPVVWGKVDVRVQASNRLADEVHYYDEDDELVRSMFFDDIGDLGGRLRPRRMRMIPADESGQFTEIIYEELEFDVDIPDRTFSLQALKRF